MPLTITRGRIKAPDRIFLIGVEGIGKSTFAAGAPAPVFLDLEAGTGHLDVARVDTPTDLAGVYAHLRALATEPHDFRTLVIDTADALDALVLAKVCRDNKWLTKEQTPDIEAPGYGKGYTAATEEWRKVILALDGLRARGMEIIITAHAQIKNFANPIGPDYSRYEPKLSRGAGALLKEWSEAVLFAIHEDMVRKDGSKMKATATGRRVVKTERSAGWDAKNRCGLPPELPLDYAAYAATRDRGTDPSPLLAEAEELLALLNGSNPTARAYVDANRNDPQALARAVNRLRQLVTEKTTHGT